MSKSVGSYSRLPKKNIEAVCRKKAVKGILQMAGERFPLRPADADEPPDPVTLNGYGTVMEQMAAQEDPPDHDPAEAAQNRCECQQCVEELSAELQY